jgi:predicted lactoylglutathione lyase
MTRKIFINLPVTDLARSIAFYRGIGAEQNAAFSNEQASMMVLSDTIHVMLLTHDFYRTFTTKEIADAHRTSQVLLCLSEDSRDGVDRLVSAAASAGGRADPGPEQRMGDFMYGRSFEDPDGHHWEVMWMDEAAMQAAHAPQPAEA